jgi:hypothetical protein
MICFWKNDLSSIGGSSRDKPPNVFQNKTENRQKVIDLDQTALLTNFWDLSNSLPRNDGKRWKSSKYSA